MVEVGDVAPNFSYIDKDGSEKQFHDLQGQKLVYFFPKAFTAGCTAQSCSLQNEYSSLKDYGVKEIFGISTDKKETLDKFTEKYGLDFILVSDHSTEISKSWGVLKKYLIFKVSDRDTFIVGEDNKISKIMENGMTGRKSDLGLKHHGEEVLNYLKL